MPRKSAWEKLPKSIRSAIVLVILVTIALVITWVLFDKATDNTTLNFKSENIAIFATGSVAVFVLILMVLSKEFRRISAVLTIVGVVGLTATYIYKTNSFERSSFVADREASPVVDELRMELQNEQERNEQLVAELQSQLQQVETSKEVILNERNQLKRQVAQLQAVMDEGSNPNINEMQQHIIRLEQEKERLQVTLNRKESEIVELRQVVEDVTIANPSVPSYKFQFPLSRQDRSFLQQILRLDTEFRERGDDRLKPRYQERAKELYKDVYRGH